MSLSLLDVKYNDGLGLAASALHESRAKPTEERPMKGRGCHRFIRTASIIGVIAIVGLGSPLTAQQTAGAKLAGTPTEMPTKKEPLRFTAFNVSMSTGLAGRTEISIERWTTEAERTQLLNLVSTATKGEKGQRELLKAVQKIKPRTGYLRTPNSIGWDLKYAVENKLPDGTRQIVVVTDKPMSFQATASQGAAIDYPFTLIEMRFKPGDKTNGEGAMLGSSAITTKNSRLELENFANENIRLTNITQEEKKQDSKKK
jgi:hypothetical protein